MTASGGSGGGGMTASGGSGGGGMTASGGGGGGGEDGKRRGRVRGRGLQAAEGRGRRATMAGSGALLLKIDKDGGNLE